MARDRTQGSDTFEGSVNLVKFAADSPSMISDKPMIKELIQLLLDHEVTHVVLSPGSRNAPISISLINNPSFTTYTVVDERAAGYFALGMAQQLQKPVAVCCTSGSAAMNYAPAVAEAYYQRIPLVVLTADRPEEWVNQGDGQTIQQQELFGKHVRAYRELRDTQGDQWHNNRLINEALIQTGRDAPGPVHINIPLRENLYGKSPSTDEGVRAIQVTPHDASISADQMDRLRKEIDEAKSVLILCGQAFPSEELNDVMREIADGGKTVVLTETHSNVSGENIHTIVDRLIMSFTSDEIQDFIPELLITVGGNIISKKIKAVFRQHTPDKHWHIDPRGEILDTYQCLSEVVPVTGYTFLKETAGALIGDGEFASRWTTRAHRNQQLHDDFAPQQPWSDLKAFHMILEQLPSESDLQMGNSSVVRYVQLFDMRGDIRYFGNRGTSGIDGCTSTAVGAANASGNMTTLITGDLAFLYDTNGLWHQHMPANLRIIVINNGGGGIFKIIDGPSNSGVLKEGFETPHGLNLGDISRAYQIDYQKATDEIELNSGLEWLYQNSNCCILEVDTSEVESQEIIKGYFSNLRQQ